MRRARINTKPNFRPVSRSRDQTSNGEADANTILPTISAEKPAMPAPSPHEHPPGEEPAEALGVKNDPQSPLAKSLANQHDGAPSSGSSTPAAVSQRRMRFSATPKLSRPRVTPAPRPSARTPSLAVLTLPRERPELDSAPEATVMGSANSNNPSDSETPPSTLPTKVAMQSSTSRPPSSPCIPSTSGLQESPVCGTTSVEDFSPSPQHGQVPQQCPQKLGDHQCSTKASDLPSVCEKSTCFDEPGLSEETDNDRILRTLKLKALMKIERRKDIERTKKTVRQNQEYTAVDRDKMTMRDLIYYLPNTSPMKYSRASEEEQAGVTSLPSQNVPEKTQETDEEEAESENEEMLMPKVRVAEDGSIILDEDSLTVRVQRTSNTAVVENSNPLFERGSTTTYTSFKTVRHVKSWSVRETDMLFLAISMVGTDFSLIGHLLPHRSHSEIKNKFKREEKVNAWRIDKAFRNKRPYDKEFFSFLLERVLAKDKEKGKSIKLVMTQPKKARKARGRKTKKSVCEEECISGGDEAPDFEMEDGGQVCAGKENENVSNVSETDTALAKTKRKRTRRVNEDKEDLSEEQVQRKKRKYTRKKPKGITSPRSDAEDNGGLFDLEGDAVNANKEEELDSNVPAPKKKRKNSRKGGEEGEIEKPAEGRKGRRRRKSLKVSSDHESIDAVESGISDEDHSVATMKCKRSKKGVVQTGESTKGNKKANRETRKGTVNEEIDKNGEASPTRSSEADKTDALIQAKAVDIPQQKTGKNSRKPKPSLCTRGRKRSTEPEVTAELQEIQEQVQKEAEVVMERTPPRVKNLHSPLKLQCLSKESEPRATPPASPAVGESSSSKQMKTQRAERVKRNLTFGKRKGRKKETADHDESENDPASKDKDSTMDETVTQESEDLVMDNTLDELKDSSYRHALDGPMLQRRPLVMLSREEVAMILSVQEQTSAEQPLPSSSSPQVSPLDLSLNTELSFQLGNLMEENSEAGQDAEGPLDNDSQNAIFEKHCEDLEISESALDQSALSSTRHVSTSLNSDMNSSVVVSKVESSCSLEKSEPQTHSKTDKGDLSYEDSACPKLNPHETHKRTVIEPPVSETHGTSSAIQDAAEANETSVELLVQESNPSPSTVLERSQESVVEAPQTGDRPQVSIPVTPEIKEDMQGSLFEPAEVMERSLESVKAMPQIRDRSQGSVLINPAIKEDVHESLLEPAEVLKRSQDFVVAPLEKEGTKGSVTSTTEIKLRSEGLLMNTPVVKEETQEEVKVATPEMKVGSQILEIKDCSQESLREPAEILEKSMETVGQATEIVEGLQGSELMTTDMEDNSEKSLPVGMSRNSQQLVLPVAEIMEGLQTTEMITTEIKENSERSLLEASEVLEKSQESVVTILEIKEGSQGALLPTSEIKEQTQGSLLEPSEVSQMPVIATPEIKEGSQGSVLIIPKFKEVLQGSDLELGDVLERSQDFPMAAPEIAEGSQESALTNPKIKQVPEGSMVTTAIAKADALQKEENGILLSTKLCSGKSDSPEHGGVLKRRSRILKPKPNLNLASRIVHSTPKQKSREPNKTISSEKLLPQSPASDQHCDLDDYSKESISSKKGSYLSRIGQDAESKPAEVSSDASATVQEQEQNSTTATLSAVSAPVLQLASDHTRNHCGVDSTASCQSVADLQKMETSCVWPLTAQTAEQEGTEQMNETCRDVCTPAKVIFSGDDQSDEPTFILTLYDVPVTQANLALASNVSVVTSELRPVEVPSQSVSTPDCTRSTYLHKEFGETAKECVGILQNEQSNLLVMVTEHSGENISMDLTATLERGAGLSAETSGSPPEREGSLSRDSIKEPADIPRAPTTHSQERSNISSMLEEKAAPKLDPIMKIDQQDMAQANQKAITPQTKDMSKEVSAKQEAEDILSIPSKDPKLLCKEGSELDFKLKKCVKSPSQDPLDPEQCEGVSQVLADVLVPVLEKMDDNVRKESTMPKEINLPGADDSSTTLGEMQEIPSEELEKMKCPTAVSNPLFSVVDSKYKPPLSEEKMTPVKRKGKLKPKLVKRPRVKNDSTKTAQPVEQNQPSLSQAIFPSQQTMVPQAKQDSGPISATKGVSDVAKFEERPEGKENVSDPPQEGVLQQMHQIIPCTVVLSKSVGPLSHGSEETEDYAGVSDVEMIDVFKPASEAMPYIAIDGKAHEEEVAGIPSQDDESTETSPCDLIQSEPAPTNLPLSWQSKIHELEDIPSEKGPWLQSDDVAIKHDLRSSSKGKESSGSVEECEGVFVPISEMGEGLNKDCQIPFVSIPTREVGPSKMQEKCRNVEKTEDFSKEFTESMKQNDSFSKESKTLTRGTGKQQVKRAGAKNDSPQIALHITEQNQPMMSQAISTKSHLTKVSQSYKDSSEISTKLEKAHILGVPEVEPDSKAKQKSNLEEELRRKHEIKPCTVSISKCFDAQIKEQSPQKAKKHLEQVPSKTLTKVGSAATSCRPEMELSLEGKDDSISSLEGMCSQGCYEAKPSPKTTRSDSLSVDSKETEAEKISDMQLKRAAVSSSALTLSEDSNKPSVMEERILESSSVSVKKKNPAKANLKPPFTKQLGKKNESSNSNLNPRMRQLPITAWAKKKSVQAAAKRETEDPSKTSEMKSSFEAKEGEGFEVEQQNTKLTETSCSKAQPSDLKSCESVPIIAEVETSEDIPTMPKLNKESIEGPSGSRVKKLPARPREAKVQVKPRLLKRTCRKGEDTAAKTGQPPSTRFTSPRSQRTRASKIKETTEQHAQDLSGESKTEKINFDCVESSFLPRDSWSPKSPALSPRIILSRVDVQTGEAGSSSSYTFASSPAKVSTSTYQPKTPPQRMSSCVVPPRRSSPPISIEDTEDEPSRVSQFFINDIFTEIEDAD